METNYYQSDLAIHSGVYLEEILEDINMTQKELSSRLGRPVSTINEIINGKKSITPDTALELEDVLRVPSYIWIGWESQYQLAIAKQKEQLQMQEESKLVKYFDYQSLVKLELVKSTNKLIEKVEELKSFFSVAKLEQIEHLKYYRPAFRQSNTHNTSSYAIASWIQACIEKTKDIPLNKLDKKLLKRSLPQIKNLINKSNFKYIQKDIKTILSSCGVAFVIIPHFKNTKINGATFYHNNRPIIAITNRGNFTDIFWFTLFHEIAHILLHSKKFFLEDDTKDNNLQELENEADQFSKDMLILNDEYINFISNNTFTKKSICDFANKLSIKPSIIIGRLMYENKINYSDPRFVKLREKFDIIN
jgi:HTH-type transcriptional regulator/antitoxin HigA